MDDTDNIFNSLILILFLFFFVLFSDKGNRVHLWDYTAKKKKKETNSEHMTYDFATLQFQKKFYSL